MQSTDWIATFKKIYDRACETYDAGNRRADTMFNAEEKAFLATIGCTAQELFDLVEDYVRYGEPDYATTLRITTLRREYFLKVQQGKPSGKLVDMNKLPSKQAVLGGFDWLPRIIVKARAKLRGEMPPELMYSCGGDRAFLHRTGIDAAEFLQEVWDAGDDDQRILNYVKSRQ